MEERRREKRYPVAYPLEIDRKDGSHELALVDVSKGGVAFSVSRELHPNDKVSIKVFLKKRMFNLSAIVVHVKRLREDLYSIGAMFLEVPKSFEEMFDKELKEITQYHRESNLYKRRSLTFESASKEYLGL